MGFFEIPIFVRPKTTGNFGSVSIILYVKGQVCPMRRKCMDRTFDERLVRVMARRNPWQSVGANFSNKIALANARVFDAAEKSTSSVERMIYYAMLPVDEDCVKK